MECKLDQDIDLDKFIDEKISENNHLVLKHGDYTYTITSLKKENGKILVEYKFNKYKFNNSKYNTEIGSYTGEANTNFIRNGKGVLKNSDGKVIYDGNWENDKYHGYGVCTDADGDK